MTRGKLFMTLFVLWNAVLLILLAVFVLRFFGVAQSYPGFTVVLLFLALAGYAGLWGLDPACKGKFARSRLLRR